MAAQQKSEMLRL
jgi:hypothetical protein